MNPSKGARQNKDKNTALHPLHDTVHCINHICIKSTTTVFLCFSAISYSGVVFFSLATCA